MGISLSEYVLGIANIVIMSLSAWWFYTSWKADRTLKGDRTPSYKITLVCTPEGYRRILASCEVSKLTRTEYFNEALNDIADKYNFPRPDDVTVH